MSKKTAGILFVFFTIVILSVIMVFISGNFLGDSGNPDLSLIIVLLIVLLLHTSLILTMIFYKNK